MIARNECYGGAVHLVTVAILYSVYVAASIKIENGSCKLLSKSGDSFDFDFQNEH